MNLLNGYISNKKCLLYIIMKKVVRTVVYLPGNLAFICVFLRYETLKFLNINAFWNVA